MPRIARGEGSYLIDSTGRRYLDGSGGPAAFCLGHGNHEINAAITAQLAQVACGYRYLFTSEPLEQLTRLILDKCGPAFGDIVFSSDGSEAVEGAMKVALQDWNAVGRSQKCRVISRQRSYHGSTLGALSLSGFAERRAHSIPLRIAGSLVQHDQQLAGGRTRRLDRNRTVDRGRGRAVE